MNIDYQIRRDRLLSSSLSPYLTVIYSGKAPVRSADEKYPFSVDRNFYYLTGLDVEDAILILIRKALHVVKAELFVNSRDLKTAKWIGASPSFTKLSEISGIEQIYPLEQWERRIHYYLVNVPTDISPKIGLNLWRCRPDDPAAISHQIASYIQKRFPEVIIQNIFPDLVQVRTTKDSDELVLMRKAQATTRKAIEELLSYARPGMNECELEGMFDFALRKQGIKETSFPSIVAGGARATILHYQDNNQPVEDNELVLLDLGSTCSHYCADISRTFPINGKFTPRQKELYEIVLKAQEIVIEAAKPGMTLLDLNELVIQFYKKALVKTGLLANGKTVTDYYYHGVSHPLGLDTHDISLSEYETLRPGMVITVEPGLYVEEEKIGIRIEDNILITENHSVNLSACIPKTVAQIEGIM